MASTVNIAEAKAKLSALADRAAAGEEIVLARAGRPLARIVPLADREPRRGGQLAHWKVPLTLDGFASEEDDIAAAEGDPDDLQRLAALAVER